MSQPKFDPKTAPVAGNSYADKAAFNKEFNAVVLKLGEAGVALQGKFDWRMVTAYWNPKGFDFTCNDWRRLHDVASRSSRLGFDPVDMPGFDPWKQAGVKSVGFTQKGKPPLAHLDIAIDRPGLCRVYILSQGDERRIDALKRSKAITARDSDVFKEVYKRLLAFGVDLDYHIGSNLTALRTRLDGINFVPKDHNALMKALTEAKYPGGDKLFAPGSRSARGHLPLSLSYLATDGTGFRQIWRPQGSDRVVAKSGGPSVNPKFSAHFGDSRNLPDLSALHCAVSKYMCNIHIDEMGFVMADAKGNVLTDPDALRHILVELLWKTNLQGKLPFWALDRVNFDIVSSPQHFSRVGVGIDVVQSKRWQATIRGSCSVDGSMECSGTVNIGARF
ncbi:MAG: hypothetical protein AB7F89_01770 [Pirellulaceae bacterium]